MTKKDFYVEYSAMDGKKRFVVYINECSTYPMEYIVRVIDELLAIGDKYCVYLDGLANGRKPIRCIFGKTTKALMLKFIKREIDAYTSIILHE
jgi:hypothetical protein